MSEDTVTIPEVDIDVAKETRKPRLEAMLFADYGALTADKKAILAGIITRIYVNPDTQETGKFYLFLRAVETTEEGFQIVVKDPTGQTVLSGVIKERAPIDQPAPHAVQVLQALAFKPVVEGLYWFAVLYQGQMLGGAALAVEYRKPEVTDGDTKD